MMYKSADKRFGVQIDAECVDDMVAHIKTAGNKETGGILIGFYNEQRDAAIVKKITGPPSDSRSDRTWFNRGVKGLQQLLNKVWKERQYYLGEWHYHPNASPDPSFCDKAQMINIATSAQYHCPEPILIIIGGSALNNTMKVFVTIEGKRLMELEKQISSIDFG